MSDYLRDRGFNPGRYVPHTRWSIAPGGGTESIDHRQDGTWWAFTTRWEIGPFSDPETAYVAAELADWGRA